MSISPSMILQYVFVVSSLAVGIVGLLIGKHTKGSFIRSTYYSWIGFVLIALSIAIVIWATSLIAFINVLGFFLIILGVIEFVFAWQILTYDTPIPWKVVSLKLTVSGLTSVGAAWILTMAGFNVYSALLFLGVLFVVAGLSFIQISRLTRDIDASVTKSV